MKNTIAKILVLSAATLLFACGEEDGSSTTVTTDSSSPASSTRVERASLEAAVPAQGQIVRGDFLLGAIVDSADAVEVRFLLDGVEVGVVNELPYQLEMNGCELTAGNHAYIVTIEGANGESDFVEQFFEIEACD